MITEYIKSNMLICCSTTDEKVIGYSSYRRTQHFKSLKDNTINDKGHICFKCGAENNITILHLHYKTLGAETGDEVAPICESCYESIINSKDINDYTFPVRKAKEDKPKKERAKRSCKTCRSYTKRVKGYNQYCLFHRTSIRDKACDKYVMARRCKSNYGVKIIPSGIIGR